MIFDFRMLIFDQLSRSRSQDSLATRNHYCGDFPRFVQQGLDTFYREQLGLDGYLEPERTLVRFLFNNRRFIGKISARFCSAQSSIIGSDGAATSHQLVRYGIANAALRNGIHQLQNAPRKCFGSLFHFFLVHAPF